MAFIAKITGIDTVLKNLLGVTKKVNSGIGRGLVKGGHYLQRESQQIVPVQKGNLKASAFTRKLSDTHVVVGYTAGYAAFVHENLNAAHGAAFNAKYASEIARANARMKSNKRRSLVYFKRGENQQAKFLERPMREKRSEILDIIAKEAMRI